MTKQTQNREEELKGEISELPQYSEDELFEVLEKNDIGEIDLKRSIALRYIEIQKELRGFQEGQKEAQQEEIEFLRLICKIKNSDYRAIKERLAKLKDALNNKGVNNEVK